MTNKLPEIGVKYSWKHAPQRYSLVVGFLRDKIVCIQDRFLDNTTDDEAIECAELMTLAGFKCVTNFKIWSEDNYNQPVSAKNAQTNEVEKAKEELRKRLKGHDEFLYSMEENETSASKHKAWLRETRYAAENLLNALDNIKTQAEPVVDNKIEEVYKDGFEIRIEGDICVITNDGKEYYRGTQRPCLLGGISSNAIVAFINAKTGRNLLLRERSYEPVAYQTTHEKPVSCSSEPTSKLPWKDVSELPEKLRANFIIRDKSGVCNLHYCNHEHKTFRLVGSNIVSQEGNATKGSYDFIAREDIDKLINFTDLINSIESMLSRQDELEKLIRKPSREVKPSCVDWSFIYDSGLTPEQILICELMIQRQDELEERVGKLEER